jgi:hypothetical protein
MNRNTQFVTLAYDDKPGGAQLAGSNDVRHRTGVRITPEDALWALPFPAVGVEGSQREGRQVYLSSATIPSGHDRLLTSSANPMIQC